MEAVAVDLSGVALVEIACGIGARSEGSLDAGCPTYRWFCGHLSSCCGSERFRPEALVDRVSAALGSGTTLERGSLDEDGSRPQLAAELDEERFQRKRRAEVELLEGAPRLADELAGALRARKTLGRAVLFQELATVGVDDRALGADRHDDQVAVPGGELLERREQLF